LNKNIRNFKIWFKIKIQSKSLLDKNTKIWI
jgi:hypothetical protein